MAAGVGNFRLLCPLQLVHSGVPGKCLGFRLFLVHSEIHINDVLFQKVLHFIDCFWSNNEISVSN